MKPLAQCRLYAFVDAEYMRGRAPADVARQLCEGGADLIQLRAKKSSRAEIARMAGEILPIVRGAGAGLVINDYCDVAAEVGADLCHLGQEDFAATPISGVSAASLSTTPFGLSTHSPDQALRAMDACPAYIAVGPVHETPTKPGARPVTLDYVRWAAANVKLPWFAIGGITLNNLDEVVLAGAQRVCVVSAILNAPNIAQACRQFRKRLPT
jgi:thiamine-phosphate pyrophosphorylase